MTQKSASADLIDITRQVMEECIEILWIVVFKPEETLQYTV